MSPASPRSSAKKVALVTGASTGIGAATARALAAKGYAVAVHFHVSAAEATEVVNLIRLAGSEAIATRGDVSMAADAARIVADTIDAFGALDVLVNNAGTPVGRSALADLDEETWDRCIDINLKGVWLVSKFAIPHLAKRPGATIVNVSSAAAHSGGANSGHYAAAKAGVHGLTRAMAKELAPAITVNCVAPGLIDTPFHEKFSTPEHVQRHIQATPLRRAGTPEEIATWIAFVAQAPFVTGQIFDINGGLVMPP